LSLLFNIFIPAMLLMQGQNWFGVSPAAVLVGALAFPIAYGLYYFLVRRKLNFISALGFISILLTGGIGLLHLDKGWIAIKEAGIPLIIGIVVIASLKTRYPLIKTFLYNPKIFNVERIERALTERNTHASFERLMTFCTIVLGASFFLSAALNYGLARYFIQSESGTEAFNTELGRMTFWSYPVIVVPSMAVMIFALWKLIGGIRALTGLSLDEALNTPPDGVDLDTESPVKTDSTTGKDG